MLEEELLHYNSTELKVFTKTKDGKIFIGREEVKPEVLNILKEQAKYLKTSQLYEVFANTVKNEAANLALIQSKNFEEVLSAKMLWHWFFVLNNMVEILSE